MHPRGATRLRSVFDGKRRRPARPLVRAPATARPPSARQDEPGRTGPGPKVTVGTESAKRRHGLAVLQFGIILFSRGRLGRATNTGACRPAPARHMMCSAIAPAVRSSSAPCAPRLGGAGGAVKICFWPFALFLQPHRAPCRQAGASRPEPCRQAFPTGRQPRPRGEEPWPVRARPLAPLQIKITN
jgi:hypothetical protein